MYFLTFNCDTNSLQYKYLSLSLQYKYLSLRLSGAQHSLFIVRYLVTCKYILDCAGPPLISHHG